jgi:uncharacterized protein (DUF1778 family)
MSDWMGNEVIIQSAYIPMIDAPPPSSATIVAVDGIALTHNVIELDDESYDALVKALEAPVEPDERLKGLFARTPIWQQ